MIRSITRIMSHSIHSSVKDIQKDMYFGTEVLNRVSFLREDPEFIQSSLFHPSTRFIFYYKQQPLIHKNFDNKLCVLTNGSNQAVIDNVDNGKLGYSGKKAIIQSGLIDNIPQWQEILTNWYNDNKNHDKNLRAKGKPIFLFMGLLDESVGLNLQSLKFAADTKEETYLDHQGRYQGIAYYAVDLSSAKELTENLINFVNDSINKLHDNPNGTPDSNGIFFTHSRAMLFSWLNTNKFCPGCGEPTIPIYAGGKLFCTNEKKHSEEDDDRYACPVKSARVSNASFPRTDMAVISVITNEDRSKILLSLNKRYAIARMYTCTAGFMEPSETIEVATRREIWEETGVTCDEINIIMTQPWPFPQNLMIGCRGIVEFNGKNEIIHLGHDNELEDARWFDTSFVRKLVYPDEVTADEKDSFNPENIIIPMPESIAFSLIKLVVDEAKNQHKL
ncbi:NUDIX domain family protein [Candida albicans]|uniref:NAD(+) diphosphatase n=1 Tax=Candida albicans TaxID=5476 RepID=A0A8H6C0J9_CANAX|nr:NUDIX domain family protein [Candida albicans]